MTTTTKFKAGDKVRIVRRVPVEAGWGNTWCPEMDKEVGTGRVLTVERVNPYGVWFSEDDMFGWPPSALELVTETDPKALKVGDVVRFKDDTDNHWMRAFNFPATTKDATFTITYADAKFVRLDGRQSAFYRTRFDLVKAAPEPAIKGFHAHTLILDEVFPAPKPKKLQSHIVVLKDSEGQLKPSSKPFVHTTKAAAETEAARLAGENPGQTFVVFSSVNDARAPEPAVVVTAHHAP